MKASLELNKINLKGCYINIGKIITEGNFTEEELREKINEQKRRIEYYKGERAAYEFILLYSPELQPLFVESSKLKEE